MEAADPMAKQARRAEPPIRAAELVGALSLATDLGTGQPLEHALRTAVLAVRLGELAGASPEELADTYYVALLHASGCTSNGHEATQLFGEDIEHRAAFFLIDPADAKQVIAFYRAHVGARSPAGGARADGRGGALQPGEGPRVVRGDVRGGAAVRRLARARPGSRGGTRVRVRALGRARACREGSAARRCRCRRASSTWRGTSRSSSPPRAPTTRAPSSSAGPARRTSPRLAELAVRDFDDALAELDETRMWEHALESEPFPQVQLSDDGIDAGFGAVAALTDLKSPWLREHSTGVADLAEAAAWRLGLPADDRRVPAARRARARPRPRRRVERDLGEARAARVRRVGARAAAPALHRARVRPVADARADRAPRRLSSRAARRVGVPPRRARPALDVAARILAAADCYSRCARRGRTGRRSSRRRPRRS